MTSTGRLRRLGLFGAVYFVQGKGLTYLSTFNARYLRSFDLSFTRIGIVGGITLAPFVLKVFIGPVGDRINLLGLGHRKPYIVLGLLSQTLAFLLLPGLLPAERYPLVVALCLLAALGTSTCDTCTNGLSIDTTAKEERGIVQGTMIDGRALNAVVIAAVIRILSQQGQWNPVLLAISAMGLVTVPLALTAFEPGTCSQDQAFSATAFRWMFAVLTSLNLLTLAALFGIFRLRHDIGYVRTLEPGR